MNLKGERWALTRFSLCKKSSSTNKRNLTLGRAFNTPNQTHGNHINKLHLIQSNNLNKLNKTQDSQNKSAQNFNHLKAFKSSTKSVKTIHLTMEWTMITRLECNKLCKSKLGACKGFLHLFTTWPRRTPQIMANSLPLTARLGTNQTQIKFIPRVKILQSSRRRKWLQSQLSKWRMSVTMNSRTQPLYSRFHMGLKTTPILDQILPTRTLTDCLL